MVMVMLMEREDEDEGMKGRRINDKMGRRQPSLIEAERGRSEMTRFFSRVFLPCKLVPTRGQLMGQLVPQGRRHQINMEAHCWVWANVWASAWRKSGYEP
jgi:hypothetical protein